ncbi:ribonuclease H-like domain-containing protein [Tanacetum coccineum]|uniref:Ribonuclease H-like domain-containing protein n=1 Tax=Tanacetum coccineum TaxID=301880 RepID=A0ABQ5ACT9_9ASTR
MLLLINETCVICCSYWILNSLSPDLFAGAIYAKTAYEMWSDLKETYDKVDGYDVFNLHKIKAAFAVVSGKESHRNTTSVGTTKPTTTAFAAKTFDNKRSNNVSTDVQSNNVSSNNATTNNSHVSLSNERLARLMSLLNDNGVSTANTNMKEYTVRLLSVHKLGGDGKLFVGFDESKCYIYDLKANWIVGIGNQCNGLYLFDVYNACKIVSNSCIASCYVSKTLWHQRLGHPANQVLDVLKTALNHSASDHLCDTLTKDVNHRNFFDNENPKRPNDDERESSYDDGTELSSDYQDDDDSGATAIDENTHYEGNVSDETNLVDNFFENTELNSESTDLPINVVRRSSKQTKFPASLNDFIVDGKVKYGVERVANYANLDDAILDNSWIDATNVEIEALNKIHTWFITDLPANRKPIICKWIYKIKYKSNGEIDRYKARLVAKGFSQRECIDFDETFSHVAKMFTIRCVIALSVKNKWPLFQLDVNNAFLYGDLDDDIYRPIP